jgi:hypothetical protein
MRRLLPFAIILVLISAACRRPGAPHSAPIAEAYAGPATLTLRKEIPLEAPAVATVKHGEKLEIVQRRRRFLKVRTPSGVEGWTEDNRLLSSEEMDALTNLSRIAQGMPSQGTAITFDLLNVHNLPARQSPSFMQVKPNEKMQVLAHSPAPRSAPPRKPLIPPTPKKTRPAKKLPEGRVPPPPRPTPPPAPENWLDLSKTNLPPEPEEPPKPVPMDDWTLIRTASGQAGWVLTRRLFMAIPDEVAQYAEGARITSYFSLGEVDDEGQKRSNWLWTTISAGLQDHDFDSFRVFIWSLRRHRFETAYIERHLKGYFPVKVHPVPLGATTYPGFSLCVEKEDGHRAQRNFAFIVNVVRFAGESACEAPPVLPLPGSQSQPTQVAANQTGASAPPAPEKGPSLSERFKAWTRKLLKK